MARTRLPYSEFDGCYDIDLVSGCHIWNRARNAAGYGRKRVGGREGKIKRAHVIAYERKHGPIPEGMLVLHTCDNPPCVNEEHLFLGTQKDNVQDMLSKGRGRWQRSNN